MIKRFGALFLAMLYTVTVLGFALNFHYCFNQLESVKVDTIAKCNKALGVSKMKCCKDSKIDVKVKDVHQTSSQSILSKLFVIHLPKLPLEDFLFSGSKNEVLKVSDRAPPFSLLDSISLFLKHCTFRI